MKRMTILGDYRAQAFSDITYLLSHAKAGLDEFAVIVQGGKIVAHLTCKYSQGAKGLFESNGYRVFDSDKMVVARLPQQPGERERIMGELSRSNVHVARSQELACGEGYCVVGIEVSNVTRALRLLAPYLLSDGLVQNQAMAPRPAVSFVPAHS